MSFYTVLILNNMFKIALGVWKKHALSEKSNSKFKAYDL